MRYMLLIHQGTTPVPGTDAWEKLSEEEQKQVYADYATINKTPGVTPADVQMQPPETATTVRVEGGETLTTDGPFVSTKEALGGYLFFEADDLDASIRSARNRPWLTKWVMASNRSKADRSVARGTSTSARSCPGNPRQRPGETQRTTPRGGPSHKTRF